eukprot:scaffold90766_cov69-Phaeocystis_antarctica.AAC.2
MPIGKTTTRSATPSCGLSSSSVRSVEVRWKRFCGLGSNTSSEALLEQQLAASMQRGRVALPHLHQAVAVVPGAHLAYLIADDVVFRRVQAHWHALRWLSLGRGRRAWMPGVSAPKRCRARTAPAADGARLVQRFERLLLRRPRPPRGLCTGRAYKCE